MVTKLIMQPLPGINPDIKRVLTVKDNILNPAVMDFHVGESTEWFWVFVRSPATLSPCNNHPSIPPPPTLQHSPYNGFQRETPCDVKPLLLDMTLFSFYEYINIYNKKEKFVHVLWLLSWSVIYICHLINWFALLESCINKFSKKHR